MKRIIKIKGWCATNWDKKVPIQEISFAETKQDIEKRYKGRQRLAQCEIKIFVNQKDWERSV
jgi:hypothetical protein